MRQKVTITIDVPDGYVLTGEYRQPRYEEHYLDENGDVCQVTSKRPTGKFLILRKVDDPALTIPGPQGWPKLQWLVKEPNGSLWFYADKPRWDIECNEWRSSGVAIYAGDIGWMPPEVVDKAPGNSIFQLETECRWQLSMTGDYWDTSCHDAVPSELEFPYCPYCGRETKIECA